MTRLRVPRPDRGAPPRGAQSRLHRHGLPRAAHAARGGLRSRADAPAPRFRSRRGRPQPIHLADRRRVGAPGPDRERDPAREPARRWASRSRKRALRAGRGGRPRGGGDPGPCPDRGHPYGQRRPGGSVRRGRQGQGAAGARQPRRERDQVLAGRRDDRGRGRASRGQCPLLGPGRGPGDPGRRGDEDLREVLPPRSADVPRGGGHGARALHLQRARDPHGRPDLGRGEREEGLDVPLRATGRVGEPADRGESRVGRAPRVRHPGSPIAPQVIDHITLRVSDFQASKAFYETVLAPLGYEAPWTDEVERAADWGDLSISQDDKPLSENVHIAFAARNRDEVHEFHRVALEAGYRDNGPPGERTYHRGYYAAFVLDPDGNNVEAVFHDR